MCSKPKAPKPDKSAQKAQDASLSMQKQQLELQKQQNEIANRQAQQQLALALETQRINSAAPPPLPNETAKTAAMPLDKGSRFSGTGSGRRKLRTDRSYSTLAIR